MDADLDVDVSPCLCLAQAVVRSAVVLAVRRLRRTSGSCVELEEARSNTAKSALRRLSGSLEGTANVKASPHVLSHVLHEDVEVDAEAVAEVEDGDGDLGLTNSYRAGESWLFFNV